jgi:cytochrome b561
MIGLGAIAVGLTEAFILIRYRKNAPAIWTSVMGAAIYIVLGALLIALPMTGALLLMQIGGGLIALFGLIQIIRSWGAAKERLARV